MKVWDSAWHWQRANLYTPIAYYHSDLFQLSKNIQPAAQMHFSWQSLQQIRDVNLDQRFLLFSLGICCPSSFAILWPGAQFQRQLLWLGIAWMPAWAMTLGLSPSHLWICNALWHVHLLARTGPWTIPPRLASRLSLVHLACPPVWRWWSSQAFQSGQNFKRKE